MFEERIAFDRGTARAIDKNGYMHVEGCRLSKACVSPYRGREIDRWQQLGLDGDKIYQVYRPAAELEKAAHTCYGMPLMDNHVPVSSSELEKTQVSKRIVGAIGSNVRMVGDYLVGDVTVWKDGALDGIYTKEQADLSCGYRYELDMKPGVAPSGQAYDMSMYDLGFNHVALVPDGRVPGAMIADSAMGDLRSETAKDASTCADACSNDAEAASAAAHDKPSRSSHASAVEAHYKALAYHQMAQKANYRAGNADKAKEHRMKASEHQGKMDEHKGQVNPGSGQIADALRCAFAQDDTHAHYAGEFGSKKGVGKQTAEQAKAVVAAGGKSDMQKAFEVKMAAQSAKADAKSKDVAAKEKEGTRSKETMANRHQQAANAHFAARSMHEQNGDHKEAEHHMQKEHEHIQAKKDLGGFPNWK